MSIKIKENNKFYVYNDNVMIFLPEIEYKELDIEKYKNSFNDKFYDFPSSIAINMINDCNLNCNYCYANQGNYNKKGIKISVPSAKKAINYIVKCIIDNGEKKAKITFFGGEPLLAYNEIKKLVLYCKNEFPQIDFRFGTITNGTLLNSAMVNFFEKNKFGLSISIDGDRSTHDKYRKFINGMGSYDKIISNIKLLNDYSRCSIRITITNDNYKIDEYIKSLLKETDIRKFTFGIDTNISTDDYEKFFIHYNNLYSNYLKDIKEGFYYDITNITMPIIHLIYRAKSFSYCKAGTAYFALASDGKIYSCHRFASNIVKEITNIDNINIINEYSKNFKKEQINHKNNVNNECYSCAFKNICSGICPYDTYVETGKFLGYSKRICKLRKKTLINMFSLIAKLDQEKTNVKKDFMTYIIKSKSNG
ncbi:radical SAM/SPASM domain-containing protein [Vallitalea guaymasensis]|uniref:Radical SAM protein n=1 Tax=Vallitalea guaymasensis TaxID=1185412 RepID=A0A8J8MBP1_9FIRM|nr:radical SAM protein [Vallitalea guaymasensis]QUH29818.1 radical SAM protein [Vallitalea guaymasensis]